MRHVSPAAALARGVTCWFSVLGVALPLFGQAPNLGPALALPAPASIAPAAGLQRNASVAVGGQSSLVVFEDDRAGERDIWAVRVDATGTPIDALPFPVCRAPGNQTLPSAVWNGTDWLVVFQSEYDPGSGYFASRVAAVRVAASGVVRDPVPMVLGQDDTGLLLAVASDGNQWFVAWTGYSAGNSDIRLRRISAAGTLLDGAGLVVQPASYQIYFGLGLAWANGTLLVSWQENGSRGRRYGASLQPIDAASVPLPVGGGVIRGGGPHFLTAWTRQTPSFTNEVVVQRLGTNLQVLDANPVPLSVPATSPNPTDVRATWDGLDWHVLWAQPVSDARTCRFSPAGVVRDPGGVLLPDNAAYVFYGPALGALPGGGVLFVWHEARFASADDVWALPRLASGAPAAERCVTLGDEAHRTPRLGPAATGHLATAIGELSAGMRLLVWRLDARGEAVDGQPIVATAVSHNRLQNGGSAWNGNHHLVVWADGQLGRVFARRLLPDGQWLDAQPIDVMPGVTPAVAANGTDFLVTALHAPQYPQYVNSYGVRVLGDGTVLDRPARLIAGSYATAAPVVELGGRWLVASELHWSHNQSQAGISLHFVDPNGTVTAAGAMSVLNIQNWGSVSLASAGTSALVASQSGSNWTNTEIYVQRVTPNGTSPVPMSVLTGAAPNGQFRPQVAWTGREYVVAYETYQNNVWSYDFEPDVYAQRLREDGTVVDAQGFALWRSADHETRVAALGGGLGRGLFAAAVHDEALAALRVSLRALRPQGLEPFGLGTPGCFGPHRLDGTEPPIAGASGFALRCDRGPAQGFGMLLAGTVADLLGSDPFGLGLRLHVSITPPATAAAVGFATDAAGVGGVSLPLPPGAAFVGMRFHTQAAFWWPGPCLPTPFGVSSSEGLTLVVQAP
ncbi:MAG: hypothetical protein JNK49_05950 [Planctomycetes bacterium]|nr:hypothetical protein [Planctomycetota bacterium]